MLAFLLLAFVVALAVLASSFTARIERLQAPISVLPNILEVSAEKHPTRDLRSRVLSSGDAPECDVTGETARPVSAFVPAADETALSGLRQNCAFFSEVFYGAAVLGRKPETDEPTFGAFPAWEIRSEDHAMRGPERWPFLSPEVGVVEDELAKMLAGEVDEIIQAALPNPEAAKASGVSGVCLDLSGFGNISPSLVLSALGVLEQHLDRSGLGQCLIGPSEAAFLRDPDILATVDIAVAVLIDAKTSPTVAPATGAWIVKQVGELHEAAKTGKLRFAISAAGISWEGGQRRSSRVSYAVAMDQAATYSSPPTFDAKASSMMVRFIDVEGRPNQIWLPDAVTMSEALKAIPESIPVVIWPIGYEDPTLWEVFLDGSAKPPETVSLGEQVIETVEDGIFVSTSEGRLGVRRFEAAISPEVGLSALSYDIIPKAPWLSEIANVSLPSLTLTFDGLGDLDDFDSVLNALSGAEVKATFLLGLEDTLLRSDRITRLLEEGHEIGLLAEGDIDGDGLVSGLDRFSFDLSQHALHHHTGTLPVLVRHPSRSPLAVSRVAELAVARELQKQGRLALPTGISAPYGQYDPRAFHEVVLAAVLSQPFGIVRFDFSSGNSKSVSDSFKTTLDLFLAEGIQILSMPEVVETDAQRLHAYTDAQPDILDKVVYGSLRFSWNSFEDFFLILALIVLIRAPIQIVLALIWRNRYPVEPNYKPEVTVVVPAFNEEQVIARTIASILDSTYRHLKVLVVDDGSADHTAGIVEELVASDERIELIRETNHGKWYAEDIAINNLDSPIFVVIDADTLLHPDAIEYLVQPFRDPKVGAVAGTVEVGNQMNLITRCQAVEYTVSQELMRRAYQAFNGILVVPGAIGAWRTDAVREAGFVTGDTITEDADLTVAVNRANYRVVYQPDALSYTEVPETLRQFMKQRLRWSLGILQVSWKHKRAILEGRGIGLISIVESLWYRLVSGVVYPLLDLLLVGLLLQSVFAFALGVQPIAFGFSFEFYLAIAAHVFLDVVNLIFAFWFKRRWDWSLLLISPLMRLGFVQLLYISSFRALYHAVTGKLDVWEKIFRTGKAKMPRKPQAPPIARKTN
ncbi:hypothetical protein GCM10011517_28470 [Actibacterium pelagium]|uniref:Glycosyltransferase n=2 Tax=Actibacterium pelagium TaxID=2029103 RepID=A0A917ALI6_9RHOB|nr:hypothetical protein GCM10011517_28470 [Actibacterium pelagium]